MNQKEKNTVLLAENISHSYGENEVLEEVSMSVKRGEMRALVGANGSGKTTLLKILAGILSPEDGKVEIAADDVSRRIGYLPQQPSFRSGFTVSETLRFYTRILDGETQESHVEKSLEDVGLSGVSNRRVSALSGGMTRLLGVAQSKVGDPPVMMLDEPTSGLDPEMTGRIFEILADIADTGNAVVLTTHDLDRAERHADEVSVIHGCDMEESGSPNEIAERHGTDSLSDAFDEVLRGGDLS